MKPVILSILLLASFTTKSQVSGLEIKDGYIKNETKKEGTFPFKKDVTTWHVTGTIVNHSASGIYSNPVVNVEYIFAPMDANGPIPGGHATTTQSETVVVAGNFSPNTATPFNVQLRNAPPPSYNSWKVTIVRATKL